ncbi:MAG: hypothetical protein CME64_05545 [Halobacteriovoraceae bacterium]|nr:hypothetical protein [Halobacteriovoraceae bacterium]
MFQNSLPFLKRILKHCVHFHGTRPRSALKRVQGKTGKHERERTREKGRAKDRCKFRDLKFKGQTQVWPFLFWGISFIYMNWFIFYFMAESIK